MPILVGVVYFNYKVDPSGLFWGAGVERVISEYMLDDAYILGYERLDGRALNEVYAKNVPYAPEVLINGSSRSMTLSGKIAPGQTFYNCSNTGADRYDFFNSYYLFAKEGKEPKTIILSIDPWLFNSSSETIDKRSNPALYAEFMHKELGFTDYSYTPKDEKEKYEALFSPSYFQSALKFYLRDRSTELQPTPIYTNINQQDAILKCPDGSIIYEQGFLRRSKDEIDIDLVTSALPPTPLLRLSDFKCLDSVFITQFEAFIEYLQKKDIEIILFLPPFHKFFYDAALAQRDLYEPFFQAEDYCRATAEKYNLKIYGSFNPEVLSLGYDDFLDSFHLRPEVIHTLLPTLENPEENSNATTNN